MTLRKNYTISIRELVKESYATAVEKGWWEEDRNIGELLALIHSEISEALEEWRSGRDIREIYFEPEQKVGGLIRLDRKPCGFTVELADLLIRVADLCGRHNLPITTALREKLAYNKTRPFRHGNKLA